MGGQAGQNGARWCERRAGREGGLLVPAQQRGAALVLCTRRDVRAYSRIGEEGGGRRCTTWHQHAFMPDVHTRVSARRGTCHSLHTERLERVLERPVGFGHGGVHVFHGSGA